MISSFVRALIAALKARPELALGKVALRASGDSGFSPTSAGSRFRLPSRFKTRRVLFFTLNREDFSFVIHLDRQPRTSRRREAQTGSRARSGSRSERTLDAVEHSRTLMEWWPFLIFHRGGLRIKVINNRCPGAPVLSSFVFLDTTRRATGLRRPLRADVCNAAKTGRRTTRPERED